MAYNVMITVRETVLVASGKADRDAAIADAVSTVQRSHPFASVEVRRVTETGGSVRGVHPDYLLVDEVQDFAEGGSDRPAAPVE